jgi:hypothetical protein
MTAWGQEILRNYLQRYLQADDEWLEIAGSAATYWQARLAQTTTVEGLPDARVKFRVRTRIVEYVADADKAMQLCLALNWHAAGWSFAYDPESRTVDALAATCALPQWDTYLLRLSEKAKLSAWMADVIAERLAVAVGGVPAFSHPKSQSAVRSEFDANYHYAQAMRRRPEWVTDPTFYEYLPMQDVAQHIAKMVGAAESSVESNAVEFRFPLDDDRRDEPVMLVGAFGRHPIVGDSYRSALVLSGAPSAAASAEVSRMTWGLFNDPQASLLGGWSYHDGRLAFTQWNTMSEVRRQERLESWDGRGVGELWGFTCTLIDPLNALSRVGLTRRNESELPAELEGQAERVVAAITEQARAAVEIGLNQLGNGEETSDARLLWLERSRVIAMAVWFNPLEPMATTLEVCRLSDDIEYLVVYRRHPFRPQYRIVGVVEPGMEITEDAASFFLPSPLPNALALWSNPKATADEVPEQLRRRVIDVAATAEQDLIAEAALVASTMGHPWELTTRGSVVADAVRTAAKESAAKDPQAVDPFAQWWDVVSQYENVTTNFNCLPDAWDGALESQRAYGEYDQFNVGPLVISYEAGGLNPDRRMKRTVEARDVGLEAVEAIFNLLQIDEEWSVRRPRGFTWWSYRLAQHVDATEPWEDDEFQLSRIRIRTEVVNSVDAAARPEKFLALANAQETLSAVVWDPQEGAITECCTGIVHQENVGWLSRMLATAAIIQNNAAHGRAQGLARVCGGVPAASNHPVSGERPEPDGMLGAPGQMAEEAKGAGRSFVGPLCSNLSDFLPGYELLGFSDDENFSCELPFVGRTPVAAKVALDLPGKSDRPETSLLRIYPDVEHPNYGAGALVTLLLPLIFDPDQIPGLVNNLNLAEARSNTHSNLLGAWCPDPTNEEQNTVAFTAFLPAILAEPTMLENQVVFQAVRSRSYGSTGGKLLRAGT